MNQYKWALNLQDYKLVKFCLFVYMYVRPVISRLSSELYRLHPPPPPPTHSPQELFHH